MSPFDPRIAKYLIADQGEVVIDEVRKHWAAIVWAVLELLLGALVLFFVFTVPAQVRWLPLLVGGAVVLHAVWRILEQHVDRFVITNMRVFRVHGILSQRIATMPLARILDISVHKPIVGRICGYGHFVFESAAQAQGLREIKFVGDPDQRGLTIQRVIQQAGLRGYASTQPPGAIPPGPPPPPMPPVPAHEMEDAAHRRSSWRPTDTAEQPRWENEGSVYGGGWVWASDDPRAGRVAPPFDPDRTDTAPIDLPR